MSHSATTPTLDWWGNPVTQTCTVPWCEGDCVLGGPGELAHHATVAHFPVSDGSLRGVERNVLVLLQQAGDAAPNVYVSTGDSDEHGVEMTLEQAERFFAAGLASVLNLRGHGPSLRAVA